MAGGAYLLYPDSAEPGSEPVEDVPADPGFAFSLLDPASPLAVAHTAGFWHNVWQRAGSAWAVQAGQYTMTQDQRPLIGATAVEGIYVNTGYSGHGVMAGPAGGQILAGLLTERPPPALSRSTASSSRPAKPSDRSLTVRSL